VEPKNIMLLGFVNKAVDYLNEHLDEKLGASLTELKNIDLDSLKKELDEELDSSLGPVRSTIETLMNAGSDAFDKFVNAEKKEEDLSYEFDRIFDVDLDEEEEPEKKDELKDLLSFYNLDSAFEVDEKSLDQDEFRNETEEEVQEEPAFEESIPADDEEILEDLKKEPLPADEEEGQFELDDEEMKMLQTIAYNVNYKEEKEAEKEDILSGANKELDSIFSELVAAETFEEPKEEDEYEQLPINQIQELVVNEIPKEERVNIIENPLVDMRMKGEEEKVQEEEPEPVIPEQVDKDDILKLMQDIQPISDTYYNRIEDYIDEQEKMEKKAAEEKKEEPEDDSREDRYVSSLIDDLKTKMDVEEESRRAKEEEFKEVYEKIHKAYPYLSNGFIRNVYELKESIAKEYPLGEKIVILHRSLFKNVENLRQYVEITLNHDYQINADEKQMIVDCFKQYTNSDGKIITSIFEVANQSALLGGEYEGYRVLFEEDLQYKGEVNKDDKEKSV